MDSESLPLVVTFRDVQAAVFVGLVEAPDKATAICQHC